jgi:predicted flap endonuclease-1-like 5' DNA nuclease
MAKLMEIEGIGETHAAKLEAAGIDSVETLLTACATPKGRDEVAEKTGISGKLILEWANHADLFRVDGIGSEYADLLEEAGVDTVPELAQRKAEHLHAKMKEINDLKALVRRLPSEKQVESWIEQAKALPRALTY